LARMAQSLRRGAQASFQETMTCKVVPPWPPTSDLQTTHTEVPLSPRTPCRTYRNNRCTQAIRMGPRNSNILQVHSLHQGRLPSLQWDLASTRVPQHALLRLNILSILSLMAQVDSRLRYPICLTDTHQLVCTLCPAMLLVVFRRLKLGRCYHRLLKHEQYLWPFPSMNLVRQTPPYRRLKTLVPSRQRSLPR